MICGFGVIGYVDQCIALMIGEGRFVYSLYSSRFCVMKYNRLNNTSGRRSGDCGGCVNMLNSILNPILIRLYHAPSETRVYT